MKATPPTSTRTTKAPAAKGIGWPRGRASQFSFPSILIPPPNAQLRSGRHDRPGVGLGDRARSGRQRLIEDLLEQPVRDGLEGEGLRDDALLRQFFVAIRSQRRSAAAHLAEPGVEVLGRLRFDLEMHVGESIPGYLSR